jgi:hypothetical protein
LYQSESTPRPITTTIILIYFSPKGTVSRDEYILKRSVCFQQFFAAVFGEN